MTNDTFDTITRSVGTDRRRTMLALGAAGLVATLAGTSGADAKQNPGKKARKKCKKQKASCVDQVTTFCSQFEGAAECQTLFLPCCEECDLAFAVICTVNARSTS